MKLNIAKTATVASHSDGEHTYRYGWYDGGRAFIAIDDEVISRAEAIRRFVPSRESQPCKTFLVDGIFYHKTLDGIVRYLLDKWNKD